MKNPQAATYSESQSALADLSGLRLGLALTRRRSLNKDLILDNFRRVTVEDMPRIWECLKNEKGRTTDFSYGGLLMWVNYFNYEFAIVADTLFIKGVVENSREIPAFSMPVGRLPLSQSVALIKSYCKRKGIRTEFSAIPEYALEGFMALNPVKTEELEDWADYLYDAEPLATLRGKKMSKKRNHVNKFDSLYPGWMLEPLTTDNADEAMAFMDIFDLEGDDNQSAIDERNLTREMLGYIRQGNQMEIGALLKVENRVAGFTMGDIKGDTLFVHVEKCSREFEGSYEKINKEFAASVCHAYPEVKYINREDNAGDEGLRRAKESYHPREMLKKYNVLF